MFGFLFTLRFIIPYFIINFILSLLWYFKSLKYFRSRKSIDINGQSVDLHEHFSEFKRYDIEHFSFGRILFGFVFLVWIKLSLTLLCVALYCIYLK